MELTISKFLTPRFPRSPVEPLAKLEYSNNGASIEDGPIFATRYLWTINAVLDVEETELLQAIYSESDYRRRKILPNTTITLTDNLQRLVERPPRTKPLAPNATEIAVGSNQIKYFAVFQTKIIQPIEIEELGENNSVSFTLQEA